MPFSLVDDDFYDHEKTEACSLAARGLWVTGFSWIGRHLTKGYIPQKTLLRFAEGNQALVDELAGAGFLDEAPGGWEYHNYAVWNKDRVAEKERRSAKAKAAANARWDRSGPGACDEHKRARRKCPSNCGMRGASAEHERSIGGAYAGHGPVLTKTNEIAAMRDASPTPTPTPTPTIQIGAQSRSGNDCSRPESEQNQITTPPAPDESPEEIGELRKLYNEWYRRGGPTKEDGTPFKENFEEFEKALRKSSATLPEFAAKARLRLDCFDQDDRPDRSFRLGMIRTFLKEGNWRHQEGPPQTVPPLAQVQTPARSFDI